MKVERGHTEREGRVLKEEHKREKCLKKNLNQNCGSTKIFRSIYTPAT